MTAHSHDAHSARSCHIVAIEPRWRWYVRLAVETVVLVALFVTVILAASLAR